MHLMAQPCVVSICEPMTGETIICGLVAKTSEPMNIVLSAFKVTCTAILRVPDSLG